MIGWMRERLRICSFIEARRPLMSSEMTERSRCPSGTFCCSISTRVCEMYCGGMRKVMPKATMGSSIAAVR